MIEGLEIALKASSNSAEELKAGSAIKFGFNDDLYLSGFNDGVIYSYEQVIKKAKLSNISLKGQTLFTTHEPHRRHAIKIAEAGIKRVVYIHDHGHRGRDVLRALGVEVVRYENE